MPQQPLHFDYPMFEFFLECPHCKNKTIEVGRDMGSWRSFHVHCPNCGPTWHNVVGKKFLKNEPIGPNEEDHNVARGYCIKNLRTGGWFSDYYNPCGTHLKYAKIIHAEKSAKVTISRMIHKDRFKKENYVRSDFRVYEIGILPEKEL